MVEAFGAKRCLKSVWSDFSSPMTSFLLVCRTGPGSCIWQKNMARLCCRVGASEG